MRRGLRSLRLDSDLLHIIFIYIINYLIWVRLRLCNGFALTIDNYVTVELVCYKSQSLGIESCCFERMESSRNPWFMIYILEKSNIETTVFSD